MNSLNLIQFTNRKGVASIEFAMFMPVLVGFSVTTMYVVRVHHTKQLSAIDADVHAIENAVLAKQQGTQSQMPAFTGTDLLELKRLLEAFKPSFNPRAGLAIGEGVADSGEGIESLGIAPAGLAKNNIGFLADTWESDVLPFPTNKSHQEECTLPASIRGIAPQLTDPTVFTALRNFSISGSGDNSGGGTQSSHSVSGLLQKQLEAIQKSTEESQRLAQKISKLEQELASLKAQPEPDNNRIYHLEQDISKGKKDLKNQAIARKDLASNKLTTDLTEEN